MNQNETEFGENLNLQAAFGPSSPFRGRSHLDRAGPERAWSRQPALFNPNRIAKIYATQQAGVAQG